MEKDNILDPKMRQNSIFKIPKYGKGQKFRLQNMIKSHVFGRETQKKSKIYALKYGKIR